MEKQNISQFVKELRKGNLKKAKDCLDNALTEKYESKKSKINTEI
jgi:hypothetical protein